MNAIHFNQLSNSAKIDAIINHAEIINEIAQGDVYRSLFVLNEIFIEMHLHIPSNEISNIQVIEKYDQLCEFVEDLNINQLTLSNG